MNFVCVQLDLAGRVKGGAYDSMSDEELRQLMREIEAIERKL